MTHTADRRRAILLQFGASRMQERSGHEGVWPAIAAEFGDIDKEAMIAAMPVDELGHAQAAFAQQPDDLYPEIFPRPRIDCDGAGVLAAVHRDAVRKRR